MGSRRTFLTGACTVATTVAVNSPMLWIPAAQAQTWNAKPEKGAKLRVLRWSRFVQGDIDQYMANVAKYTEQTGVQVRVDSESWEDVRPKAAVAANVGSGADIILSTNDDANLYPDKLLDVTDLCEYLGAKYGGWFPACHAFLRPDGKRWIGVPLGASGSVIVYRKSHMQAAGFETFPTEVDGFLKLMQGLKANGTPAGFALGNATGDSGWTQWLLWAFGGKLVDKQGKVVLDSPETLKSLEFGRKMYETMVPGTLSWLDPNNNKAFLDGQISLTNNGISIYYAAKNSKDENVRKMAEDIHHAPFPLGPVGTPTEWHLFFNQMVFRYTKYPNAAKDFLRFMMEQEQYLPWMRAAFGYTAPPLDAFTKDPFWTDDPKATAYRDCVRNLRPAGFDGPLGYASAGAAADFIVPNMVAEAASNQSTPKDAIARAVARARRYYRS